MCYYYRGYLCGLSTSIIDRVFSQQNLCSQKTLTSIHMIAQDREEITILHKLILGWCIQVISFSVAAEDWMGLTIR